MTKKMKTYWRPQKDPTSIFYTAPQVAKLYDFPEADGTGQTIGIIELGGGYTNEQIIKYMQIIDPVIYKNYNADNITSVSVNGGINNPYSYNDSIEVALDIETIVSLVPKANIRVYFAPNNDEDFQDAVQTAISDNCNVISISWGAAESEWSSSQMQSFNNVCASGVAQGIAIYCSAGDSGAYDSTSTLNINFPASSPNVTACGGTSIITENGVITSETVWNDSSDSSTGGGLSVEFLKPSYQTNITYTQLEESTYRGIPDISGNANPDTGYKILTLKEGDINVYEPMIIGGTSAVSPLWSAYTARMNQLYNMNITLVQSTIDSSSTYLCSDITVGNNNYYNATTGWDGCSGWGSPSSNLVNYYASIAPTTSYCDLNTLIELMSDNENANSFWNPGPGHYIFDQNDMMSIFLFNNAIISSLNL